jgi:hypothetical protein
METGVSDDDIAVLKIHNWGWFNERRNSKQENTMKTTVKYIAPWLAAATIGGMVVLAPIASADTDPLVPYGTNPTSPYVLGYHVSNHDEAYSTNGFLDVPF